MWSVSPWEIMGAYYITTRQALVYSWIPFTYDSDSTINKPLNADILHLSCTNQEDLYIAAMKYRKLYLFVAMQHLSWFLEPRYGRPWYSANCKSSLCIFLLDIAQANYSVSCEANFASLLYFLFVNSSVICAKVWVCNVYNMLRLAY